MRRSLGAKGALWPLMALALTSWGCGSGEGGLPFSLRAQEPEGDSATALSAGQQSAAGENPADTLAPAFPEPPALLSVATVPVEGFTGPGGRPFEVTLGRPARLDRDRRIGQRTFHISLRSDARESYVCSSCHVAGSTIVGPERTQDVHADVQPVHPSAAGARCLTCHAPDDVEKLQLSGGERVTMAHTYRLCAQCHFPEAEAWAGGGHGKRLDGWRGRRVVMGCADCHDPHRPALTPRDPMPGPRLPLSGKER